MSRKKIFYFIFIGIIIGASITLLSFTCVNKIPGKTAYAQDFSDRSIESLKDTQYSFRQVANDVLPVVVEVATIEVTKQAAPERQGWPWNFLFPPSDSENNDSKEQEYRSPGLGSGVIVKKEGRKVYVLTNNHVVQNADEITIILYDKREFPAKLIGKDKRKDLALIEIETDNTNIPVAKLGDSNDLYIGDWVLAIGNPFGYVSSVTAGIVSAKGRHGPAENISDFIQTDAAINQGNSGGALVNLKGEVIGINTWIATPTGLSIGLGFAIPINNAKKAIEDFIKYGKVEYGWLGVSIQDLVPPIASDIELENIKGAFIYNVYKDSPADRGGLQPGDYITKINSTKIEDANELILIVGDLTPKEDSFFEVIRFGERTTVSVKIGIRKENEVIASQFKDLWPGLTVIPLDNKLINELKLPSGQKGVIISTVEKSKAQIAGLKRYDIITKINDMQINNIMDFYRAINDKNKKKFNFYYVREGIEFEIEITL